MDNNQGIEGHVSQYPDPEQSGLSFPWLNQYQPVAADNLSARLQPIIHEAFVPHDDGSTATAGSYLQTRRRSSIMLAGEGSLEPSAVLRDSEEDPDFVESSIEAEYAAPCVHLVSHH